MTGLQPYPEYRDSGVAWLGNIPSHWECAHGGAVLQQKKVSNRGMLESVVLSLSYGRIVVKPPEKLHGLVPESFETYQVVDPGDIIIRPTDLQNDWNTIRVGLAQDRGIITSAYICFRTREPLSAEFAHLLLLGYDLKKVFYGMGSGLRQNLDWSDFKRMPILLPPPDEQLAIVRFIRDMDRKINRFIRNRRRLIEVLNEQKQAIINRAVTRGLDPNAPLKPSGIDWLGDVPKHWEVTRIKHLFRESDARSGDGSGLLLSLTRRRGLVPHHEVSERPPSASDLSKYKVCKPGELVMNRMQAWSGMFAAVTQEGIISPDYCVFIPKRRMDVRYFELLFKTRLYVDQFIVFSKGIGSGFNRLYTPDFGAIAVAVPPEEEQARLLVKIDDDCTELNTLIARTEREIDLIREYRTRLITDVVTGKVDVRGLAPAEAPLDDEQIDEGIEDEEMLGDDEPELVEEAADADD